MVGGTATTAVCRACWPRSAPRTIIPFYAMTERGPRS